MSFVPILLYGVAPPAVQSCLSDTCLRPQWCCNAFVPTICAFVHGFELDERHYHVPVNIHPCGFLVYAGLGRKCSMVFLSLMRTWLQRMATTHALPLSLLLWSATQSAGTTYRHLSHSHGAGGVSPTNLTCLHGASTGVASWHHRTWPYTPQVLLCTP
jgi:hypothetical protein